jgi:hypothetical protein
VQQKSFPVEERVRAGAVPVVGFENAINLVLGFVGAAAEFVWLLAVDCLSEHALPSGKSFFQPPS